MALRARADPLSAAAQKPRPVPDPQPPTGSLASPPDCGRSACECVEALAHLHRVERLVDELEHAAAPASPQPLLAGFKRRGNQDHGEDPELEIVGIASGPGRD